LRFYCRLMWPAAAFAVFSLNAPSGYSRCSGLHQPRLMLHLCSRSFTRLPRHLLAWLRQVGLVGQDLDQPQALRPAQWRH